jgi:hypothetical protein
LFQKNQENEIKSCSFKPEISNKLFISKNDSNVTRSGAYLKKDKDKENRFEKLYNIGKNILKNKKNKTKQEFENYDEKECYFKPDMSK